MRKFVFLSAFLLGVVASSLVPGCEAFFCPKPFLDEIPQGTYDITSTDLDCSGCAGLAGTLVVTGDRLTVDAETPEGETFRASYAY